VNRRGIGTRLLNQLTEQFIEDGARMMIVDTEMQNEAALQFFRKHGFGDEIEHVYLSRNLTTHPEYMRRRAVKSKT
jgi:ribosomal protein S18 acetylase RimI-like enzyme